MPSFRTFPMLLLALSVPNNLESPSKCLLNSSSLVANGRFPINMVVS